VDYCQQKATSSGDASSGSLKFSDLLLTTGFSDSDLSLLSWLQCIPSDTFSCPFEQKTLNVDVERLEKPSLETSWTEHMLITPIKPNIFPHSATPSTRSKSVDIMSRSLNMGYGDARSSHLGGSGPSSTLSVELEKMSRSFASFHLTGKKSMNTSVDRLFEESSVTELPTIAEHHEPAPKLPAKVGVGDKSVNPASATAAGDLYREYVRQKQKSNVDNRNGSPSSDPQQQLLSPENGAPPVFLPRQPFPGMNHNFLPAAPLR
jgi:hypothetical protein